MLDFIPVAKNNPRLVNQQGAYTITNVCDMDVFIRDSEDDENKYIFQKSISVRERYRILKELDLMGINEMTLFPGLDGICKTMTSNFFKSPKIGKTPAQRMAELMRLLEKMKKE